MNVLGVDCISRQQAIDAFPALLPNIGYNKKVITEVLQKLPPVTLQEPRWIPVSEKLPNDRNWYLGIFKEPDTGWINPLPFICDYVGRETKATTKGYWILRGFTDWDDYHIDYYFNLECVAWMPLPQLYKEESEETEKVRMKTNRDVLQETFGHIQFTLDERFCHLEDALTIRTEDGEDMKFTNWLDRTYVERKEENNDKDN